MSSELICDNCQRRINQGTYLKLIPVEFHSPRRTTHFCCYDCVEQYARNGPRFPRVQRTDGAA